tara:strand:+ start:574 stop:1605 length:1032 start_codon:yes stop_codon:yes gene_type:complete
MSKNRENYNIAIIGATGIVGESFLDILSSRNFPLGEIYAIASKRSAGKTIRFGKGVLEIIDIASFDFSKVDIAFFSAGSEVSAMYAKKAAKSGAVVIDNTSHFRYDDEIPLIVPEVNPSAIANYSKKNIIANPNCSTIQMLVALKPIHDLFDIQKIIVSTYQAVSGSGKSGINELLEQTHSYMNQQKIGVNIYPKQIAFNVIPFVDSFNENGYTKEEMKMVWETHKILDENIDVNATAVRVPVIMGHSESVTIETKKSVDIGVLKDRYNDLDYIKLLDDPKNDEYPTAVIDGSGTDHVYVGRIRKDLVNDKILNIWVVADNVRKGAALNSVQIAELLIKDNYL